MKSKDRENDYPKLLCLQIILQFLIIVNQTVSDGLLKYVDFLKIV